MESTSGRGGRLPLVILAMLVVAALAAAWWYLARPGGDGPAAAPAALPTLAFSPSACPTANDLPGTGWDFPQKPGIVESWVAAGDVARTRVHGWWLWAAINQPPPGGSEPLWRGWCTSTQAYSDPGLADPFEAAAGPHAPATAAASLGARRAANNSASAEPIQLPGGPVYPVPASLQGKCFDSGTKSLVDGPGFASTGDIMIGGVIYNPPAFHSIRDQKLYLAETLAAKQPKSRSDPPASIALARNSVVLKPRLWPVPASGYSALPLWDNATEDGGTYAGFERQSLWPRAVAVTAQPRPGVDRVDVQYLWNVKQADGTSPWGPQTYRQARVVPIRRFYAYRPDLSAMDPCDRAIIDASSLWAYNRPFRQGDYLILIAMHIMTKEQEAWTFQSFWWSDRPDDPVFGADRPAIPAAQGPWRNYLMASTYGIPVPRAAPPAAGAGRPGQPRPAAAAAALWGVAFNPYLELAADHPIATNCMNCHHRGGYPSVEDPNAFGAKYLTGLPSDPGAIGVLRPGNPLFNGLVLTDKQWTLPNRAAPLRAPPTPAAAGARRPR
ncbi:MAG TPA: hypothetical protein VF759_11350 [Allosphingosinicella sp.]|jgi:hypothetical protein